MTRIQLKRLKELDRPPVAFVLDGQPTHALKGDTVLTAVLTQSARLRTNEFSRLPRAGFCVMGACQDCWVQLADGRSLRACQTMIEPGMHVCTGRAAEGETL
ncbi:2Fe-2S iron-sulfur cluster binding domain-containing protein [Variovorax sp. HW608]|uniref:(2Fe-2S)-binding protein n=1 Tax=Variovorax sp. HW608 TaxID=1034889 RepID=UPI00081FAE4B|nr:(2Fe-2S)-binding protein [Variovorax sp. HW608]SCK22736.1 2Fe-2S iron-sulfur cluster binding domain-containing protein [Variovorax sp. HW608]